MTARVDRADVVAQAPRGACAIRAKSRDLRKDRTSCLATAESGPRKPFDPVQPMLVRLLISQPILFAHRLYWWSSAHITRRGIQCQAGRGSGSISTKERRALARRGDFLSVRPTNARHEPRVLIPPCAERIVPARGGDMLWNTMSADDRGGLLARRRHRPYRHPTTISWACAVLQSAAPRIGGRHASPTAIGHPVR